MRIRLIKTYQTLLWGQRYKSLLQSLPLCQRTSMRCRHSFPLRLLQLLIKKKRLYRKPITILMMRYVRAQRRKRCQSLLPRFSMTRRLLLLSLIEIRQPLIRVTDRCMILVPTCRDLNSRPLIFSTMWNPARALMPRRWRRTTPASPRHLATMALPFPI